MSCLKIIVESIPPILTDFYNIGHCLATFLHFHRKKKHSQYLVLSASSKYRKVLLLPNLAFKGFLDLQPCPAMGAGASVRRLLHCPTMPTIHTRCATFWQSVGEVVYTLTECPFALCLGYRAKMLALGKDCLLKLISWFHNLSSLFYSLRNT